MQSLMRDGACALQVRKEFRRLDALTSNDSHEVSFGSTLRRAWSSNPVGGPCIFVTPPTSFRMNCNINIRSPVAQERSPGRERVVISTLPLAILGAGGSHSNLPVGYRAFRSDRIGTGLYFLF